MGVSCVYPEVGFHGFQIPRGRGLEAFTLEMSCSSWWKCAESHKTPLRVSQRSNPTPHQSPSLAYRDPKAAYDSERRTLHDQVCASNPRQFPWKDCGGGETSMIGR